MSFDFCENVEQLAGYTPGFQPSDQSAIKINTNENPYPPSPRVFEALTNLQAPDLQRYPRVFWDEFRQVAAEIHDIDPDRIICGNGGDELLSLLVRCCCNSQRPLAYPIPTYSLYPVLARIQNCPVIEVPFGSDYRIPTSLYDTQARLTILCNPNAPTGTLIKIDDIADLAQNIQGVLAIDEAYVDFAENNCLSLLSRFDNIFILRSLSKGYSLAGMRFGYGMGSARIIEAMIKIKDSYNVNAATQAAATAALADQSYFRQNVKKIIDQRQRLITALAQLGFDVHPSQTNFVLAAIKSPPARIIHEKLAEKNIYIRYFDTEDLKDKLRITVGTAQQMDVLIRTLREVLP